MFVTTASRSQRSMLSSQYRRPREGAMVRPRAGQFAKINQGTATFTDGAQGLVIHAPANAATNWRNLVVPAPAGKFSVVARFQLLYSSLGTTPEFALILRNSSNGRFIAIADVLSSGSFAIERWPNETSAINARPQTTVLWPFDNVWFRADCSGSAITAQMSLDGIDWSAPFSAESYSSYLTAAGGNLDQVGFGVQCSNALVDLAVNSFQIGLPR